MQRARCRNCGYIIIKSGLQNPYLCRDCEKFLLEWDAIQGTYGFLNA